MSHIRTLFVLALAVAAIPVRAVEQTVIVHPSGTEVPENLLRMEVSLTETLRPPLDVGHLRLLDDRGNPIEEPFLDFILPSRDDRALTFLLHPGRVKSGVGANLSLGRALKAGSSVTLVITHPGLHSPVRKTWRVTPADVSGPRPDEWRFEPPSPGTRSPMIVHLEAPISWSARLLIAVLGPDGHRIGGGSSLEEGECVWRFLPSDPWRVGRHVLVTHPDLEDPAGNRISAPFEMRDAHLQSDGRGAELPFQVVKE